MTLLEYINIGNLNVRGITKNEEKRNVVKDAIKYNIPILAVSETHIKYREEITVTTEGNGEWKLYFIFNKPK